MRCSWPRRVLASSSPTTASESTAAAVRLRPPADDVVGEITENGGAAVACCASVAEERGAASIVETAIDASMPPEMCAPAAAFLAHESCPLNGEILQIGMGGVSRIAVVHTSGISKSPLTAEDIAENLDAIMDASQARVTDAIGIEH
jgi:hypothetical protein